MKRIIIVLLALFLVAPIFSQDELNVLGSSKEEGLQKGYKCLVELGYLRGNGDAFYNALKLNIINGYQFNPYFFMGIGTGIWIHPAGREPLFPLYVDFRGYLLNKKISPFLAMDSGLIFEEALFIMPSVGVSWKISKHFALDLSFGYNLGWAPNIGSDGGAY